MLSQSTGRQDGSHAQTYHGGIKKAKCPSVLIEQDISQAYQKHAGQLTEAPLTKNRKPPRRCKKSRHSPPTHRPPTGRNVSPGEVPIAAVTSTVTNESNGLGWSAKPREYRHVTCSNPTATPTGPPSHRAASIAVSSGRAWLPSPLRPESARHLETGDAESQSSLRQYRTTNQQGGRGRREPELLGAAGRNCGKRGGDP